jgi:hypothetical protein
MIAMGNAENGGFPPLKCKSYHFFNAKFQFRWPFPDPKANGNGLSVHSQWTSVAFEAKWMRFSPFSLDDYL